jgi:dTDP-glucose 4,6-dehydratase
LQIRDWLYVEDHARAIERVLESGVVGETYNIGGNSEKSNIEIVDFICKTLDQIRPRKDGKSYLELKRHVSDRPGHDRRYAINATKITSQLGWKPQETFETGMIKTINWYLDNLDWVLNVTSGQYQKWISKHYEALK